MKQAILITAYKDFEQLIELINMFDEDFNIYIHIDKKSFVNLAIYENLSNISNIKYIIRKYKINWGGLNHLKAILLLAEKALSDKENIFFHLITGQDFPVKKNEYFKNLFFHSTNQKYNYLEYFKLPTLDWTRGGMDRLEDYNLFDLFNAKSSFGYKCIAISRKIQHKLNIKRRIDFSMQLFGGSTYWTLNKDTLKYVVEFTYRNPLFFKRFRFTFCPEEIYIHTIIMNSEYANYVINDNLRFIDWKSGRGFPAILDESDYESIILSNKIFARKIDSKRNKLLYMLAYYVSNEKELL